MTKQPLIDDHTEIDIGKAERLLGWRARVTTANGIGRLVPGEPNVGAGCGDRIGDESHAKNALIIGMTGQSTASPVSVAENLTFPWASVCRPAVGRYAPRGIKLCRMCPQRERSCGILWVRNEESSFSEGAMAGDSDNR